MPRFPNSLSFRLIVDDRRLLRTRDSRVRVHRSRPVHGPDGLESVLWLDLGQLDDPSHDIPAFTRFRANGVVKQVRHYRLGRLHDPEPGVPAVRGFFANGARKYEEHFRYGWRHDAPGRARDPQVARRRDAAHRAPLCRRSPPRPSTESGARRLTLAGTVAPMPIDRETLLRHADHARSRAYAPYSRFRMGAAVATDTGEVVEGALVENVSLGLAMCAERVALFGAATHGARPVSLALVAPRTDGALTYPCGACLQVALELGGPDVEIVVADTDGHTDAASVADLLPRGPKKH